MIWHLTRAVLIIVALHVNVAESYKDPMKFLLVSNARNGTISYLHLPASGSFSGSEKVITLIPGGGDLVHPQGLAVDHHRKRLLVADPNIQKVLAFPLSVGSKSTLTVGHKVTLASNVESRWVAVDGRGNIFFTNEAKNQILKIPSQGGPAEAVYSGGPDNLGSGVSAPGGISTDNFHLFWTNKVDGDKAGVLITAPNMPSASKGVSAIANNMIKSYGICLALDDIYYTAPEKTVYGMNKNVGVPTKVVDSLVNPRGCVWDGDSTIYVADRGLGGIYYFLGPQATLQQTSVQKVADAEDAFGVAIFSSRCRCMMTTVYFINLVAWITRMI